MANSFETDNPGLPASMHITATEPRPSSCKLKTFKTTLHTCLHPYSGASSACVMGTGNPDKFPTVHIYETNSTLNIYLSGMTVIKLAAQAALAAVLRNWNQPLQTIYKV